MVSYFFGSSQPTDNQDEKQSEGPVDASVYPDLGPEFEPELLFAQLKDVVEDKDGKEWQI